MTHYWPHGPQYHTLLAPRSPVSHTHLYLCGCVGADKADTLEHVNITVRNHTSERKAFISWHDPVMPNGLILTYEIELRKVDVSDVSIYIYIYIYYGSSGSNLHCDTHCGEVRDR